MSTKSAKKDEQQVLQPVFQEPLKLGQKKTVGTATFSSMAKQAESLVSGDDSVIFDNYNNGVVFKTARLGQNDCLNVKTTDRALNNVARVNFANGTAVSGICDGYSLDSKGGLTPLYDPTMALSTVFGYETTQSVETVRKNLQAEIERRIADSVLLTSKFQQTSADCEAAVRMMHYIDFDEENHRMLFTIKYEDDAGTEQTHVDLMPAETITVTEGSIYDPNVGLTEIDTVTSSEHTTMIVNRDSVEIDGDCAVSGLLSVPTVNANAIEADSVEANSVAANETSTASLAAEGALIGVMSFADENPINGVTTTLDELSETTLPTSLAVGTALAGTAESLVTYTDEMVNALAETVAADVDNLGQLITFNAECIDEIRNSTGGFVSDDPTYQWVLWHNIKNWIQQGITDNLKSLNQQDERYWGNCNVPTDELYRLLGWASALGQNTTWSMSTFGHRSTTVKWGVDNALSANVDTKLVCYGNVDHGFFTEGYAGFHTDNWVYIGDNDDKPAECKGHNLYVAGTSWFVGDVTVTVNGQATKINDLVKRVEELEEKVKYQADLEARVAQLEKLLMHFTAK